MNINRYFLKKASFKIFVIFAFVILFFIFLSFYQGNTKNGLMIARSIVTSVFNPNYSFLFNFTKNGVPYLIFETLAIAYLGTFFSTILALPLAILSSPRFTNKIVSMLALSLITIIRIFPAIVIGIMFIRVSGPGAFTGVLTVSLSSIGSLGALFRNNFNEIDDRYQNFGLSIGLTKPKMIRTIMIPLTFSNIVSNILYRFELNVRNATILGIIGAGGIGAPLIFAINGYRWSDVGALLIGMMLTIIIVESASGFIRKRFIRQ